MKELNTTLYGKKEEENEEDRCQQNVTSSFNKEV